MLCAVSQGETSLGDWEHIRDYVMADTLPLLLDYDLCVIGTFLQNESPTSKEACPMHATGSGCACYRGSTDHMGQGCVGAI